VGIDHGGPDVRLFAAAGNDAWPMAVAGRQRGLHEILRVASVAGEQVRDANESTPARGHERLEFRFLLPIHALPIYVRRDVAGMPAAVPVFSCGVGVFSCGVGVFSCGQLRGDL
jgi:hypothetical protein